MPPSSISIGAIADSITKLILENLNREALHRSMAMTQEVDLLRSEIRQLKAELHMMINLDYRCGEYRTALSFYATEWGVGLPTDALLKDEGKMARETLHDGDWG